MTEHKWNMVFANRSNPSLYPPGSPWTQPMVQIFSQLPSIFNGTYMAIYGQVNFSPSVDSLLVIYDPYSTPAGALRRYGAQNVFSVITEVSPQPHVIFQLYLSQIRAGYVVLVSSRGLEVYTPIDSVTVSGTVVIDDSVPLQVAITSQPIAVSVQDGTPVNVKVTNSTVGVQVLNTASSPAVVKVDSMPDVTGSVTVTSLPMPIDVQGSVAITTLPAVTGTVSVSSLPTVSVSSLPSVTLSTGSTVGVSSLPNVTLSTGTVVGVQPATSGTTFTVNSATGNPLDVVFPTTATMNVAPASGSVFTIAGDKNFPCTPPIPGELQGILNVRIADVAVMRAPNPLFSFVGLGANNVQVNRTLPVEPWLDSAAGSTAGPPQWRTQRGVDLFGGDGSYPGQAKSVVQEVSLEMLEALKSQISAPETARALAQAHTLSVSPESELVASLGVLELE